MKIFLTLMVAVCFSNSAWASIDTSRHFTNEWVVHMSGGPEEAQLLAIEMGYDYKGQVVGFKDVYRLEKSDHPKRFRRDLSYLTKRLSNDSRVSWVEHQEIREREKRDLLEINQRRRPELFRFEIPESPPEDTSVEEEDDLKPKSERSLMDQFLFDLMELKPLRWSLIRHGRFNDELWEKQWYLHNGSGSKNKALDMNVLPCYDMGLTGRGVRVLILDDGIEGHHADLRDNYDPYISYDMNDEDNDPTPQYNTENSHGTRCAGEVAMTANNHLCGVGVAFKANIGGIRMLDGPVTDRIEAASLSYARELVDVYSASWGPTDNGETLDGPGRLVRASFLDGIEKGRNGSGTVFVWASGNGGGKGDSCSCDGYVNSIYTLTVSSASQNGKFPWYGEKCAATLTTTYSSGFVNENMIVTTDLEGQCTDSHTGTSASAPIAAGIIALLLEARSDLTWRDVQHIVVRTSRPEPLMHNVGWKKNGAGLYVNTRFGYGLMDAHRMVEVAKDWISVPSQKHCNVSHEIKNETLYPGKKFKAMLPIDCTEVHYLEHVELEVNIFNSYRGALEVYLTSPQGTKEQLLYQRQRDKSAAGFKRWKFMSVLTWNENPQGSWIVEILDTCIHCKRGIVGDMALTVHGTREPPHYLTDILRPIIDDNQLARKAANNFNLGNILKKLAEM